MINNHRSYLLTTHSKWNGSDSIVILEFGLTPVWSKETTGLCSEILFLVCENFHGNDTFVVMRVDLYSGKVPRVKTFQNL